jgi:transcriptional regulator GlxA family with amidase domain
MLKHVSLGGPNQRAWIVRVSEVPAIERAKAMLRAPYDRVLDVAVACGFKTQQHFAQVFRDVCGVSPTEYRQDFIGSDVTCA